MNISPTIIIRGGVWWPAIVMGMGNAHAHHHMIGVTNVHQLSGQAINPGQLNHLIQWGTGIPIPDGLDGPIGLGHVLR
jgi:hypothetical protein